MRKCEQDMINLINQSRTGNAGGNTIVTFTIWDDYDVHLHGNLIAEKRDNKITLLDGGWESVTTKSRLNALCVGLKIKDASVWQKKVYGIHQKVSLMAQKLLH